ncbi:hypothetical protein BZG00_10675 [Salinivibrio kushneri]|uniref:Chromosome partitioning protein ParA n=1 Tax=Salinivibrio kushneri TaxID=1908198 RepID=A0AB36JXF6_9GAMM|nr:hypothetical protein [Salinivibrio kushneri]OOE39342.1 hypothetical protein BZG00_10675 [Salinivibrio kushneri]QCP02424.1 hypothetical protein FCN78_08495 [Salinivibrio kushneri]
MKVIASTIKSAQWQAWLSQQTSPFPIVQSGTSAHPRDSEALIIANPCTLADIEQDLVSFDEVILHVWDAKSTLADALRNGADDKAIEETLAEWRRFTKALLAWLPNHQHKVNLISHTHATFYVEAWQGWLTSLGIEWPEAMSMAPRTQQDEYDIFAAYYIIQSPEFAQLEQLLFSVTLPMGDSYPTLPFDMTSLAQQSQQAVEQLRYANKQMEKREQDASQLQYALEESNTKQTKLTGQLESLQKQLAEAEKANKASDQAWSRKLEEKEAATLQLENELQRVQASLEHVYQDEQQQRKALLTETKAQQTVLAEKTDLENQLAASQQQIKQLTQALQDAKQQKSNYEQTIAKVNAEKDAQAVEMDNLACELSKVQARLENAFDQEQKLQQQVKAHNVKVTNITKRHRLLKLDLAKAVAEKQSLEKQINRYHSSPLWKVTEPVRNLRHSPKRKRAEALAEQARLIELTDLFDKEWYLQQNPDVASQSDLDPIEHYLRFGAQEGRNPSPQFNTEWYLKTYPDVAESGVNPLVHFIENGQVEGRQPSAQLLEYQP